MRRWTLPIVAGALIVVGLVGMAAVTALGPRSGPESFGADGGMDAMFIEQMIPHHDDAIAMADLALTRAEHPEIKQLARDIKRTQTAENAQMRRWYQEWFDAEVPDVGGARGMMGRRRGMMGGSDDLADLENADEFDKAFIEAMIPHHQMAIMMSRMAGAASARPEMRDLTRSIVDAQSSEITKMRRWYEEWYGR